jgi:hypothetical protein
VAACYPTCQHIPLPSPLYSPRSWYCRAPCPPVRRNILPLVRCKRPILLIAIGPAAVDHFHFPHWPGYCNFHSTLLFLALYKQRAASPQHSFSFQPRGKQHLVDQPLCPNVDQHLMHQPPDPPQYQA